MNLCMSIYYLSHAFREQKQLMMVSRSAPHDSIWLPNYYQCKEIQYDDTYHDATCCISMEAFQPNDILIELPCSHYFSVSSITKWFRIRSTCPICRQKVKLI